MPTSSKYILRVIIDLKKASTACVGRSIGVLCREHLTARQVLCQIERISDTEVAHKAEMVIGKLLGRPTPQSKFASAKTCETKTVLLDDESVSQLSQRWCAEGIADTTLVIPHMFYLNLLQCCIRNLEANAPELLKNACVFFDYALLDHVSEIVQRSFWGERDEVLEYAQTTGLHCIDPGRQLFLENIISLACYMFPAKHLIFKDDDFFLASQGVSRKLIDPLERGYLLSGTFCRRMDRIHTCFFALRPEFLRDELSLFDDGENLYADTEVDTGTRTYRALLNRERGVFVIGNHEDVVLGNHLCHCASELWCDLPRILNFHYPVDLLPKGLSDLKSNVPILLEALAMHSAVCPEGRQYEVIGQNIRELAETDFGVYFGKVYNNFHWLAQQDGVSTLISDRMPNG